MPMHDWKDERGWDSVHPLWLVYLVEHLQERMPSGDKAIIVTDSPPMNPTPAEIREDARPHRTIHVIREGRLVAALELVSPRNKDRESAKETYANRYIGYFKLGVHLLLVDVLPRPRGFSFSDAITTDLGIEAPPLPPPFAAAFRVDGPIPVEDGIGSEVSLWRCPLLVGEALPTLPLALGTDDAVMVDLEATDDRAAKRVYLE